MPTPETKEDALPLSRLTGGTNALLRSILQHLDQGVLLQGPQAEIILANQSALDMLGLTEEQLLGLTSFDPGWHVLKEDGSPFPGPEHPVPTAIATRAPVRDVLMGVYRPKSEDRVWLNVTAVPELDEAGDVRHVVCSFTDVTQRRAAQAALQREHELLRQVMATSVAGIIVLEPSGQIVYANPAAEQILGLTKSEIEELTYDAPEWHSTDLDGGPWPDENQPFVRVLSTREPVFNVRHCIEWPNGNRKALTINGAPVMGEDGEIERLVFAILDITDFLRAEEEQTKYNARMEHLARQESLSVLAGGIAHDFNNLLVGVLTAADLARDELEADHGATRHIQLISRTAQRAAELTRQLLAYSGRGQFIIEPLNLTHVAREMLDIAGVVSKEIDLKLDLQEDLPSIQADAIQVKQILLNLLLNAADASKGLDGAVHLRTGVMHADVGVLRSVNTAGERLEPGPFVYAEVEDRGIGMTPETLERIFDPFFTTKEYGHGLGLAAVLGVLRGHGGFVQVDSAAGEGTRFRVGFPAIEAPSAAIPAKTPLPTLELALPGTVLVIDDEKMVRTVTQRLLQKRNITTLIAEDGAAGLETFAAHRDEICAVMLDLTMPGLTGDEVLARLRADRPDVPVLLMSGFTQHEVENPDQYTRFIAKPFRAQALMDGLHNLVFGG